MAEVPSNVILCHVVFFDVSKMFLPPFTLLSLLSPFLVHTLLPFLPPSLFVSGRQMTQGRSGKLLVLVRDSSQALINPTFSKNMKAVGEGAIQPPST